MGRTKTLRSRVTQILNKKTETKYFDIGIENQQLYHNLGYGTTLIPPTTLSSLPLWFNPWINILQGPARFERIGDKVMPRGMSIKLYIANKYDRPNTMHRVMVCILPKLYAGTITTSNFQHLQIPNQGVNGNNMTLPADTDRGVKVLYDRVHRMSPMQKDIGNTGKEMTKLVKLWIKRKRAGPIIYDTTNSTLVNRPLAVYVIPYEQYSTLTTDNVASCAGFLRMYYKDF